MQKQRLSNTTYVREAWDGAESPLVLWQPLAAALRWGKRPLYAIPYRQYSFVAALALMLSMGLVGTAAATQTSTSTHYSVTETQFGSGSAQQQCSTSYCSKASAGDSTVGSASSDSYSAQFSSNTTDTPLLEVITSGGLQDLGVLDDDHTGTASGTIAVRDYLSNGYVIQIVGAPPTQGTHVLTALTTPTTSHQGAEQFGINLVANTAPSMGADPVKAPSGDSGLSDITADYSSANLFKYIDGDIVAHDPAADGETDYTMSLILNVSNVTPGGRYTGVFSAIVVPQY